MKTRNDIYTGALISYINDIKPYHCKITQIVEQVNFYDNINVKLSENHKIGIHFDSIWSNDNLYSDGLRTRYTLPPFLTPRYSTNINNFNYSSNNSLTYLAENFGIHRAFQVNASQGVENVLIDNKNGLEGYDYFLSKGIFSFQTTGTNWTQTNLNELRDGTISYFSTNPWMNVNEIVVPIGSESVWEIQITDIFDTKEIISDSLNVTISLTDQITSNIFYEIYENNELILPHSVTEVPGTSITFGFTYPNERVVKVTAALDNTIFNFTTLSKQWIVNHDLNTTKIIPQCYLLIDGQYIAVLPLSIEIISPNQIVVNFTDFHVGKVILREVSNQHEFNNVSLIEIPYNSTQIDYWIFIEHLGVLTSVLVNGIINNGVLTISLGQNYSGIVNYLLNEKQETQFSVTDTFTNTLIGIGSVKFPFTSSTLSFIPNFGGVLVIGDKTTIRPKQQIAIHPNNTDEIWSLIKINPIAYQEPIYSNPTSHEKIVNLIPFAPAFIEAPAETWTLTYSALIKAFIISGSVSGSGFDPVKLGPWYDNGVIRLKLILDPSQFEVGGVIDRQAIFTESHRDEIAYINSYTDFAIAQGALVDGDSFTLVVNQDKPNYLVYGSITQQYEFATVGKYFWNGKIGFMPDLPYYSVSPNNALTPLHLSNGLMPNRHYDELGYGDYFEAEILQTVEGQNTVNSNSTWFLAEQYPLQWNIKCGTLLYDRIYSDAFQSALVSINFQKPPRFDAVDERFDFVYHDFVTPTNITFPNQSFMVNSDLIGLLPMALIGSEYSNFETTTLSLTYGNSGALNCTIMSSSTPIPNNTSFTINIRTNFIKPFHSRNVVLIKDSVFDALVIKTFNNDKLELRINHHYPELGSGNGYGDNFVLPTFIMPNMRGAGALTSFDFDAYDLLPAYDELQVYGENLAPSKQPTMPSRLGSYDLLLQNCPFSNAGTISYLFDNDTQQYVSVLDFNPEFVTAYLPINTGFSLTSYQTDEYNTLTGVMISEHLKISDIERFSDTIQIKLTEHLIDDISDQDQILIFPSVTDNNLSIIDRMSSFCGYDSFPEHYDVLGFDAQYYEALIFEKIPGLTSFVSPFNGFDIGTLPGITFDVGGNPICWAKFYDMYATEFTVEVPSAVNNVVLIYQSMDISLSQAQNPPLDPVEQVRTSQILIEGTDYIIDEFHHNYLIIPGHKTYKIEIKPTTYGPQPLIVVVF